MLAERQVLGRAPSLAASPWDPVQDLPMVPQATPQRAPALGPLPVVASWVPVRNYSVVPWVASLQALELEHSLMGQSWGTGQGQCALVQEPGQVP